MLRRVSNQVSLCQLGDGLQKELNIFSGHSPGNLRSVDQPRVASPRQLVIGLASGFEEERVRAELIYAFFSLTPPFRLPYFTRI